MTGREFARSELLLGTEALESLKGKCVAIFGIGGVGSYVAEALARTGVGRLHLIDHDTVSETNINRQIIALHSTVGRPKTLVMQERIQDINPAAQVEVHSCFFLPENAAEFDFSEYDYVIDAVDTVTAKLEIIMQAERTGVPVISSMGTGNKLEPSAFMIADIYQTSVCPLARVMRRELKKRGVQHCKVLYSREKPIAAEQGQEYQEDGVDRRSIPGSVAFVPSVAGLMIAGEVIRDLIAV